MSLFFQVDARDVHSDRVIISKLLRCTKGAKMIYPGLIKRLLQMI